MAFTMELEEAQDMDALLPKEPRSASRMGGPARVASAIGATVLLAIGGKAAWGGMSISERDVMGASEGGCSEDGGYCGDSLCCSSPTSRCWRKNEHWASCNNTCDSNMKWEEEGWVKKDTKIWDCHQLSPAHDGENCLYSKECVASDSHCFKKNEHWASCNKTCAHNLQWEDGAWAEKYEHVWDCHILSVAEDGMNCMESKACKNADSHCFLKNEHWASCNATCSPNKQWNHEASFWEKTEEPVWNCKKLSCVEDGDDCLDSRCCKREGSTCFRKDEHWASCNATCTSSYKWEDGWKDQGEGEKVWSCEELLPKDIDDTPPCDLSECDGCQGEQCTYCREDKERDCCLDGFCKGSQGEQVAKCKEENLATCCEEKSGRCASTAGASEGTNGTTPEA